MKRKIEIYQYGSQLDPTGPTRYSPSDWVDISISGSSPSERSCSIGAPQVPNSSASSSAAGVCSEQPSSAAGLLEDHPGPDLTNNKGRVVKLQCEIRETFEQVVRSAGDEHLFGESESNYTAAAELIHGESNKTHFMQFLLDDFTSNGPHGETYKEAIQMWIDTITPPSPYYFKLIKGAGDPIRNHSMEVGSLLPIPTLVPILIQIVSHILEIFGVVNHIVPDHFPGEFPERPLQWQ